MTIKQTITLCRAVNVYCVWNADYQEFRLWHKDMNAERTAYFTDDRYDAVDTALYMAAEVRKTKQQWQKFCGRIR